MYLHGFLRFSIDNQDVVNLLCEMFPQKITIDDLTNIFDSERDSLIFAMLGKILKLYDRSMTHLINKNGELRVVINAFKTMYLATNMFVFLYYVPT
jgi:hypothetical protein